MKLLKDLLFLILFFNLAISAFSQWIYIEDNEFRKDGKKWFINGANTPWDHWNDLGGNFDYEWWNSHFLELRKAGINATRVWLTCNGAGGVDISSNGYILGPTSAFWKDMDSLMNIARRHKIYVMGALISFDHTKEGNPKYLEWRKMYEDTTNMNSFAENYAVPLVKRYADNPYLFSVDVCNEIIWVSDTEGTESGSVPWNNIQYLLAKTAQRIHEESDVLVCESNYIKYVSPNYSGNKYNDGLLQKQVNDPDAYLDFYKIHYYSWVYPWFDGFHALHSPAHYGINDKPCITGEISANIIKGNSSTGDEVFTMSVPEAYELHHRNGWQGAMAWTSNGVDVHGNLDNNLRKATLQFEHNHFDLVQNDHRPSNPYDPYYSYSGRTDFSDPKSPTMYYGGSYIHVKFEGTQLKVALSNVKSKIDQGILFVIDSLAPIEKIIEKDAADVVFDIVSNLQDTIHSLHIVKMEGPGAGAFGLTFKGLILEEGENIFPVDEPELKIEVFGDSFAEGVGGDCPPTGDGDCGLNNSWNSYANVLARKLNAQIYNNGIGGLAVMDNTGWYQSKTTGLETTYDKLVPTNENGNSYKKWQFDRYTPNLVIFGMGINDEYDPQEVAFNDTTEWKNAYKNIIRNLVNEYGKDVKVILAPGNIHTTKANRYSENIVREMNEQGYSIWYYKYSFDLDAHPNKIEHEKMANELYNFINEKNILNNNNENPFLYGLYVISENGTVDVNPQGDVFSKNEQITLNVEPDNGYIFAGWSGDISSLEFNQEIIVDRNLKITANFVPEISEDIIDDKDTQTVFSGDWQTLNADILHHQSLHYSNDPGGYFELAFKGNALNLYGMKSPKGENNAQIFIDGLLTNDKADFSSTDSLAHQKILSIGNLQDDEHHLRIKNGNDGDYIYFDYITVEEQPSSILNAPGNEGKFLLHPTAILKGESAIVYVKEPEMIGNVELIVHTMNGIPIIRKQMDSLQEKNRIHLNTLNKGIYFLTLKSGAMTKSEKFVVL